MRRATSLNSCVMKMIKEAVFSCPSLYLFALKSYMAFQAVDGR